MSKPTRMKDIAAEIDGYLKNFERNPAINSRNGALRLLPYWKAGSWSSGRYIGVRYVNFQGTSYLTRQEAEAYLAFLKSGGIGKHFRALS